MSRARSTITFHSSPIFIQNIVVTQASRANSEHQNKKRKNLSINVNNCQNGSKCIQNSLFESKSSLFSVENLVASIMGLRRRGELPDLPPLSPLSRILVWGFKNWVGSASPVFSLRKHSLFVVI